jgi:hypothetical protein
MKTRLMFLRLANRRFAWLKRLLPRWFKRFLLLYLFAVDDGCISSLCSRKWLEQEVLPKLPRLGFRRMLFVGTAPYTRHYERIVTDCGGVWITSDVNPSAAVWGAKEHVVGPVEQINLWFPQRSFDAVILNGVFGFGVDSELQRNASLGAIAVILKQNGLLLLGWNPGVTVDPLNLEQMRQGFRPASGLPFAPRHEFVSEGHTYDFLIWEGGGLGAVEQAR